MAKRSKAALKLSLTKSAFVEILLNLFEHLLFRIFLTLSKLLRNILDALQTADTFTLAIKLDNNGQGLGKEILSVNIQFASSKFEVPREGIRIASTHILVLFSLMLCHA